MRNLFRLGNWTRRMPVIVFDNLRGSGWKFFIAFRIDWISIKPEIVFVQYHVHRGTSAYEDTELHRSEVQYFSSFSGIVRTTSLAVHMAWFFPAQVRSTWWVLASWSLLRWGGAQRGCNHCLRHRTALQVSLSPTVIDLICLWVLPIWGRLSECSTHSRDCRGNFTMFTLSRAPSMPYFAPALTHRCVDALGTSVPSPQPARKSFTLWPLDHASSEYVSASFSIRTVPQNLHDLLAIV